jgi:hypothetical protein
MCSFRKENTVDAPASAPFKFNPEASDFTVTPEITTSTGAHCAPLLHEAEKHRTRFLELSPQGFYGQVSSQDFLSYDNGHLQRSSSVLPFSPGPGAFYASGSEEYQAPNHHYNGHNCASSCEVLTRYFSFAPERVSGRIYTTQTELRALLYLRIRLQRLGENSPIFLSNRDQENILRGAMERLTGKLKHHKWDGDYDPGEIAAVLGAVHHKHVTRKKENAAMKRYIFPVLLPWENLQKLTE